MMSNCTSNRNLLIDLPLFLCIQFCFCENLNIFLKTFLYKLKYLKSSFLVVIHKLVFMIIYIVLIT